MRFSFWLQDKEFRLDLDRVGDGSFLVRVGEKKVRVEVEFIREEEMLLKIEGRVHDVFIRSNASSYFVHLDGECYQVEKKSVRQILGPQQEARHRAEVATSMPGKIVKILREEGDEVREGEAVLILEAMKMQNEIKAPCSGRITRIGPRAGDSVETGALLFSVE